MLWTGLLDFLYSIAMYKNWSEQNKKGGIEMLKRNCFGGFMDIHFKVGKKRFRIEEFSIGWWITTIGTTLAVTAGVLFIYSFLWVVLGYPAH